MKFLTFRCCKAFVAFVAAMSLSVNTFAASPQVVNSFYNYAKTNQISKIRRLQSMGYGIDVRTDDGISAYCLAKNDDNTQAMRLLERLGADKNQKCTTIAWGKTAAVALGVAAVGGGVALAAGGGGGGGGGDSDPCASKPNSQWFVDHCECVPGYEDPGDGICYKILTCGANQHQDKDKCVCNDGYIDQGGICYAELTCGANAHQEGNECVCDGGYIEQGGVCYAELTCGANAHQEGNKCVCDGGYIEQGGVCYAELSCGAHGTQEGNICKCEEGYTGADCRGCAPGYYGYDGTCYKILDCVHGQLIDGVCKCDTGYAGETCDECATDYIEQPDGSCYADLKCVHGEQNGNVCECEEGYDGVTCNACAADYVTGPDNLCYPRLDCGLHGEQNGGECKCEEGYAGDTCNDCASDYKRFDNVCYKILNCGGENGEAGKQIKDKCECNEGYGRGADGLCVPDGTDKVGFEGNTNHNGGEIKIENNDFADVYGMKYDAITFEEYVGNQNYLYNTYASASGAVSGDWNSLIDITNNSDGDVYGMYSENNVYNLFANITKDVKGEVTSTINIKNHGNGDVYGIKGDNSIYNVCVVNSSDIDPNSIKIVGSVKIENDGSGTSYGLYGTDVYNIDRNEGDAEKYASAEISVTSTYDYLNDVLNGGDEGGDVYGIYTLNTANNSGTIEVSSVSGTATGIGSKEENQGNGEISHSGTMTVSSEKGSAYGISSDGSEITVAENAQINVSSKSQDNKDAAYGIYGDGGLSVNIENGVQSIEIMSEAGNAYGVYVSSNSAKNITNNFGQETSETTDGEEESGEEEVPDEGEANEPAKGIVVTSTSGEAYGIYGIFNSITNNGKVEVNGSKAAYGIKSETNKDNDNITVTNSGSVLSHSDGGDAYGIHSENGASNSGTIEVSSVSGNAVGMVGVGVNNTGILNVSSTGNNVYGLQWHEVLMSLLIRVQTKVQSMFPETMTLTDITHQVRYRLLLLTKRVALLSVTTLPVIYTAYMPVMRLPSVVLRIKMKER